MSVAHIAASLFAANEGFLADVDKEKVVDYEAALHSYMDTKYQDLLDQINSDGNYDDDTVARLKAALEDFAANGSW